MMKLSDGCFVKITCFIAIGGTLSEMITVADDTIQVNGTIMIVCSLAIGSIIGEIINIEAKLESTWFGTKK